MYVSEEGFLSGILVNLNAKINNPLSMQCTTTVTTSGNANPECLKPHEKYLENTVGTFSILEFDSTKNAIAAFNKIASSNTKFPYSCQYESEGSFQTEQNIVCNYFNYILQYHQYDFQQNGWLFKVIPQDLEENSATVSKILEKIYSSSLFIDKMNADTVVESSTISKINDYKLIKGNDTDLLVLYITITNNEKTSIRMKEFHAMDSKFNVFSQVYSDIIVPKCEGLHTAKDYELGFGQAMISGKCTPNETVSIKEPEFEFSEQCEKNRGMVIPTQTKTQKICIQVGKNSSHFFLFPVGSIYNDSEDRIFINTAYADTTPSQKSSSEGGGCLIATATYGSELAPQVQLLREIRDSKLSQTESGKSFMSTFNSFYYSFSPTIADWERESPVFKEMVKVTLTPMLTSLTLLHYVEIDTEEEMLGYGIGVILLNIGMYFVAPAVLIMSLKKRLDSFRSQ